MNRRRRTGRRTDDERVVIPQRVEELTAAWFTDVLATGATVTEVRCEEIGIGVGFMGEVHRCHLTWETVAGAGDAAALPSVGDREDPDAGPRELRGGRRAALVRTRDRRLPDPPIDARRSDAGLLPRGDGPRSGTVDAAPAVLPVRSSLRSVASTG